jgi:hypothetical protein
MNQPLRPAKLLALLVAAAALPSFADDRPPEAPAAPYTPAITPDEVLTRIAFLASDDLAGRESGTDGGRRAEEWVAAEFRRMGLAPLSATADSPFTDVPMPGRAVPEESWIEITAADGAPQRFGHDLGAVPFSFSKGGEAAGGVVFAGFGITAPDHKYDDYAGVDVKGKVVLVLRHGPGEKDEKSPWRDVRRRAGEMAFGAKAKRAADAGAAAILLVNDMHHKEDALPVEAPGAPSPIPVFAVRRATADLLLAPTGKTLVQLQTEIDGDLKPRSAELPGLSVRVHATVTDVVGRNVVFRIPGTDEKLRDEAVLVCAHADHVGKGFFGSVSNSVGQIHNGADDNASGTAALLEVAEAMSAAPCKRTVIFAAWCGEEKGLIGSEHFCDHPLWDLSKIAVCVNMDMLGRYRDAAPADAGLLACGMPSAVGTEEPVLRLAAAHKVKVTPSWEAWEQSDHFSFYRKGVPSLFLHTGVHPDYHRPSDKWWKVAAEPEARIARMTADLVRELADAPTRPTFAKKPPRPVLGVRSLDAEGGAGAKLAQVVPGLAANVAGLQVGDVITSYGGTKVASAGDLTALIQASKPDEIVEVTFKRGAEEKTVKVKVSGM